MAKYYAWSELRNGGTVVEIDLPTGGKRTVVQERNLIPVGSQVTKTKVGCTDDEWNHLLATGSVRAYPVPEGADEYTSASRAMLQSLVTDSGDIDMNKLLELGLTNPPAVNPPATEVPEGA